MPARLITGDCRDELRSLEANSVHCCVSSPPYFGLRDYGVSEQIGAEKSAADYVSELVAVFSEVRRVLREDGTLWLNLGDSYNAAGRKGHGGRKGYKQGTVRASAAGVDGRDRATDATLKPKDLIGIPWRVAFALQADGWYLRQEIIWSKPNAMPEPVKDRCVKSHEHIFLLSKSERYYFDYEAIQEPATCARLRGSGPMVKRGTGRNDAAQLGDHRTRGKSSGMRNKRDVWVVNTKGTTEEHFAAYPEELIIPCILAGCPAGGVVLDPFGGSGTTALVADRLKRNSILIELNPKSTAIARKRLSSDLFPVALESSPPA